MPRSISRRNLLQTIAASPLSLAAWAGSPPALRIGVTDWNLNLGANPEAVRLAARLGFDAVQVSFGRKIIGGKMPVDDAGVIAQYRAAVEKNSIPIDGTCVDRLHDNGLKSDKLAPKWVSDSIRLTRDLKVRILLVPFFGPWAMEKQQEMAYVGDALRELAPEAEKANVILGLEDTISAEDNVRIMDRARSKNVLVYYDVGNSTKNGFDVVREIRWLGKDRICQFHLKDNPHLLGQGPIQFAPILRAIRDIGFSGYANLETDCPANELDADMRKNLSYIRQVEKSAWAA